MSGDWFDPPAPIEKATPAAIAAPDPIRDIEDEIHKESASVLNAALAFGEIDPAWDSPPDEWIEKFGQLEAERRLRLAKYALMNQKEAPVGLRMAKDTFVGMSRARAAEKTSVKTLNMTFVQMTRPMPTFPTKEVDK